MGKVFISYAHEDLGRAERVCDRLRVVGLTPWLYQRAPASFEDISAVVDRQIDEVDAVLVLWSEHSRSSVWVRGEALCGLGKDKYFGLLLDQLIPPVPFNAIAVPNLSDWSGLNDHLGWNALVRGLAAKSANREAILACLNAAQTGERNAAATLAQQAELQFPDPALEEPQEPLDEGRKYDDVQAIVLAAQETMGSATKLDLHAAMTQAALDQEMLRDAAFVVSKDDSVSYPEGATFKVVRTISEALSRINGRGLIVIAGGVYDECITVPKDLRIVGLGDVSRRPIIRANMKQPAVLFNDSARLENVAIETREDEHAVRCASGQPVILKCDIRRFSHSEQSGGSAFHIAGKANPIVIGCSIASTNCNALHFVAQSGGQFVGVNIVSLRGNAVNCQGRPSFAGCTIEAIEGPAIVVRKGIPTFHECEISGQGASSVVRVIGKASPRIKESRINAVRQLAFDFEGASAGRYEGNIVSHQVDAEAGRGRNGLSDFFGLLKSKEDAMVRRATGIDRIIRIGAESRPLFIANVTPEGGLIEPRLN